MKFAILKNFATFLNDFDRLYEIKRVDENIFLLRVGKPNGKNVTLFSENLQKKEVIQNFYIDITRFSNDIFTTNEIFGTNSAKNRATSFDMSLQKLSNSKIVRAKTDGNNKILIFDITKSNTYKQQNFSLHFELTNRYTNVILLDENSKILDAFRFLDGEKNSREVLKNSHLSPLPQPEKSFATEDYDEEILQKTLSENYTKIIEKRLQNLKNRALNFLETKKNKLILLRKMLPSPQELQNERDNLQKIAQNLMQNRDDFTPYANAQILKNGQKILMQKTFSNVNDAVNWHFSRAKKAKKKFLGIKIQAQNLHEKIDFLQREIDFVQRGKNPEILKIFQKNVSKKQDPGKFVTFFVENHKFSVGRNERENIELLQNARANDVWMHAKDVVSAHGIIHCGKNQPSLAVISQCAEILAGVTKSNIHGKISIDYTLRKFIRMKNGANVHYDRQKTLHF